MDEVNKILNSLSPKEIEAILHCETEGNGKYFYQIHKLVQKELMVFVEVPELMNIKAPRLSKLGKIIKDILKRNQALESWKWLYYNGIHSHTLRYRNMLYHQGGRTETDDVVVFCTTLMEACEERLPICKLNRWLGYIQREVISSGLTTVEFERDITRPLFRELDFSDLF